MARRRDDARAGDWLMGDQPRNADGGPSLFDVPPSGPSQNKDERQGGKSVRTRPRSERRAARDSKETKVSANVRTVEPPNVEAGVSANSHGTNPPDKSADVSENLGAPEPRFAQAPSPGNSAPPDDYDPFADMFGGVNFDAFEPSNKGTQVHANPETIAPRFAQTTGSSDDAADPWADFHSTTGGALDQDPWQEVPSPPNSDATVSANSRTDVWENFDADEPADPPSAVPMRLSDATPQADDNTPWSDDNDLPEGFHVLPNQETDVSSRDGSHPSEFAQTSNTPFADREAEAWDPWAEGGEDIPDGHVDDGSAKPRFTASEVYENAGSQKRTLPQTQELPTEGTDERSSPQPKVRENDPFAEPPTDQTPEHSRDGSQEPANFQYESQREKPPAEVSKHPGTGEPSRNGSENQTNESSGEPWFTDAGTDSNQGSSEPRFTQTHEPTQDDSGNWDPWGEETGVSSNFGAPVSEFTKNSGSVESHGGPAENSRASEQEFFGSQKPEDVGSSEQEKTSRFPAEDFEEVIGGDEEKDHRKYLKWAAIILAAMLALALMVGGGAFGYVKYTQYRQQQIERQEQDAARKELASAKAQYDETLSKAKTLLETVGKSPVSTDAQVRKDSDELSKLTEPEQEQTTAEGFNNQTKELSAAMGSLSNSYAAAMKAKAKSMSDELAALIDKANTLGDAPDGDDKTRMQTIAGEWTGRTVDEADINDAATAIQELKDLTGKVEQAKTDAENARKAKEEADRKAAEDAARAQQQSTPAPSYTPTYRPTYTPPKKTYTPAPAPKPTTQAPTTSAPQPAPQTPTGNVGGNIG